MQHSITAQPALLSKMNERQILRTLLVHGSLSRAELTRATGMTAPTVSKAVDAQLNYGLLEEHEPEVAFGRPAKKLRLSGRKSQVLGVVIDAGRCSVVSTGMDGRVSEEQTRYFPTPHSYEALINTAAMEASDFLHTADKTTLGIGVSVPGLVDYRTNQALFSPNLALTNEQFPAADLEKRVGIKSVLVQEEHALCLAERWFGSARDLDDFAILDVSTGVGLGVMSGGRLLMGHSGLAGELGHLTVQPSGRKCGCGNHGCLETVACDSALARTVSQQLGREVTIDDVLALSECGELMLADPLESICDYLAVGVAAVINLFNPSALFIHGRLFALDDSLFSRMVRRAGERSLPPAFAVCQIVQARGSKRQGAIAGIIEHLIESIVPAGSPQPLATHTDRVVTAISTGS